MRYELGERVSRLADWLKYGSSPECAATTGGRACSYYEHNGVHQPADECVRACVDDPSRRSEHHVFVHPNYLVRVARAAKLRTPLILLTRR